RGRAAVDLTLMNRTRRVREVGLAAAEFLEPAAGAGDAHRHRDRAFGLAPELFGDRFGDRIDRARSIHRADAALSRLRSASPARQHHREGKSQQRRRGRTLPPPLAAGHTKSVHGRAIHEAETYRRGISHLFLVCKFHVNRLVTWE